jgi:hypothetical protein
MLSRQAQKKEKENFQHYNILSVYEVKNETSTSSTYVSLVFYRTVRSRKILVKKQLHVLFSEHGRFEWFCTKIPMDLLGLTPKRRIGPMGAKPVLGSVAWSHTIFYIFWIFFPNASQNKLCVSTNLMILGTTDQKQWVFEVFGQGLAKAGMRWSQWGGVDHMRKKMGAGGRKKGGSFRTKEACSAAGRRPLVVGHYAVNSSNFLFFILFVLFWTYKEFLGILEEWMYNTRIFWSLLLHLEVLNLPFLMKIGDFTFFSNFIFAKFRVYLDLHIYSWDFCFIKNWDHKKFHKFC